MDYELLGSDFEPKLMPKLRTSTSTWVAVWLQMVPCFQVLFLNGWIAPMGIAYIGAWFSFSIERDPTLGCAKPLDCLFGTVYPTHFRSFWCFVWFEAWSLQMECCSHWCQERSTSSLQMLSAFAVWIQWLTRWSLLGPSFWKGWTNGRSLAVTVVLLRCFNAPGMQLGELLLGGTVPLIYGDVSRDNLPENILRSGWNSWKNSVSPTGVDHRLLSDVSALHVFFGIVLASPFVTYRFGSAILTPQKNESEPSRRARLKGMSQSNRS